ncbi:MAG: beta-Ala-His dipeptidase [Victivallaceae bacterium]|nr:beta-Ala-His dipeptidase [Victivallaceae bacterium]
MSGVFPEGKVWEFFSTICSIPHPSGHEEALAERLERFAAEHDFLCRRDGAGNLLITRPAAAGFESAPKVTMQGHLDMVPCASVPGVDFLTDPIAAVRDGDRISTGGRTTLGADNGIGVSLALSALLDAEPGGALAALFTVEEETGLAGAKFADPAVLDCDALINLDSEEEGTLVVGCAGGARMKVEFGTAPEPCPAGMTGYELAVSGLKGGHSGSDIHRGRGNAIVILAEALAALPTVRVGSVKGGVVSNVIPGSASATIAVPENCAVVAAAVAKVAAKWLSALGAEGAGLKITFSPVRTPETVWSDTAQNLIIGTLLKTPYGALEFDEKWKVPAMSNNIATIASNGAVCHILLSQRAQNDRCRQQLTAELTALYETAGAEVGCGEKYPGWIPVESPLVVAAEAVYRRVFGASPEVVVMHAGLECGIFAQKRPGLQMLSFGPDMWNVHSVDEAVSVASVERTRLFLTALLNELRRVRI